MTGFPKDDKLEIMHRLEREGRWDKGREYKEMVRRLGESNDTAWAMMLEMFPPLDHLGRLSYPEGFWLSRDEWEMFHFLYDLRPKFMEYVRRHYPKPAPAGS